MDEAMKRHHRFCVAPFRRQNGQLEPRDILECGDETTAFKKGRALMDRVDGVVFFRIDCSEDGDVWSEVELLATVGEVPPEADAA